MNISDVASILNLSCTEQFEISSISIDSRTIQPGDLYLAIQGERLDGHDYITKAVENGAVAVVGEKPTEEVHVPQFIVKNSIDALTMLATHHRSRFTCPVIALTGSNGKTTVKEMLAAILPKPSFATEGNLNNHIGVPLSALKLKATHQYAVFELGANHLGEIAQTVDIVKPKVTLINNIAPAHIEGFGSIEGVAIAKGEIHQGLAPGGTAVINDDDEYAHFWDTYLTDKNVVRFSVDKPVDITAHDVVIDENGCAGFMLETPKGRADIQLKVFGRHNISNALAAAACAYSLGISLNHIQNGLNQFTGVQGRMTQVQGVCGSVVIDDTYNANLSSVLSALGVLSLKKGKKILVLGDMGELGQWAKQHHQKVGQAAQELGVDDVFTFGSLSRETSLTFGQEEHHFEEHQALAESLIKQIDEHTTILVKGSRMAKMENVVEMIRYKPEN